MKRGAIHQLLRVPEGDAISNAAAVMRRHFRAWGHASEIVCEARRVPRRSAARFAIWSPSPPRWLRRQSPSSISRSGTHQPRWAALRCRKAILYHNVTPAHYFRCCNPSLAADLEAGRRQAAALAGAAELALADSAYNAAELAAMGYRDVRVLPLLIDL